LNFIYFFLFSDMHLFEDKKWSAKFAISWYFIVEGAAIGNWAASIPVVKQEHNISDGTLGIVLFAAAGGAVIAVPLVTFLSTWYGSAVTTLFGAVLMVAVFPIIGVTADFYNLILGTFLLGFALLVLDSSMNTQAVLLELATNSHTLGHFHAVYAIGCVVGALIGGALFSLDFSIFYEFIIFSGSLLIPDVVCFFYLYDYKEELTINSAAVASLIKEERKFSFLSSLSVSLAINEDNPDYVRSISNENRHHPHRSFDYNPLIPQVHEVTGPSPLISNNFPHSVTTVRDEESGSLNSCVPKDYFSLCVICILLFVGYFGEGSVGDWSALYLTTHWDCSPLAATFGYVGFQGSITIGRFFSDKVVQTVGRQRLLILSGITSGVGLCIAVFASLLPVDNLSLSVVIIGFAIGGIGLSSLSPTVVSLIGTGVEGFPSTTAMSITTAVGYLGVLIGPPILGNFAEFCGGLNWSFLLDAGMIACLSIIVLFLPRKYHQMRNPVSH
jgi:MFS family permease